MKTTWIAVLITLALAAPATAGDTRFLEGSVAADGLEAVRLEAGVGDIAIVADINIDEVTVEVELKPRRGGFFSSLKKAQREVDEAELRMDVSRGVLRLEIKSTSDDRHFEEHWNIVLPPRLAVDLELGVGDVEIRGLTGTLTAEIGVGEILAEAVSGDLGLEIGVGEATVRAAAADYGSVEGSGGVGDARLTVRGERISSSGFVGHSAEWTGEGEHTIEIEVGVGDARVTLD
jgi:hypothetical protein